jgi:hypothetical protein
MIKQEYTMNKIEYITQNDGVVRKCTTTNKNSKFQFLGDNYNLHALIGARDIKVYEDDYDFETKVVKDGFGRMFLYGYREEMRVEEPEDRVDEMWSLMEDIKDAESILKSPGPIWGRVPCIYTCETGHTYVQEYVSKEEKKLNDNENLSWIIKLIHRIR